MKRGGSVEDDFSGAMSRRKSGGEISHCIRNDRRRNERVTLAELAGFDAFLAGFVQEGVDFGLGFFFLFFEGLDLLVDGSEVVAFVQLFAGGGGGFSGGEIF